VNEGHAALCSSSEWALHIADTVLPEALGDLTLGVEVLEVGPGYGASTEQLSRGGGRLTAIEIDEAIAAELTKRFPAVTVVRGSAVDLPFPAGRFTAVVCFTMLHHVSSVAAQDAFFAQARRVLAPGGLFAGSDSMADPRLREFHADDRYVPVDPATLPDRLRRPGFTDIDVRITAPGKRFAFTARVPGRVPTARRPERISA